MLVILTGILGTIGVSIFSSIASVLLADKLRSPRLELEIIEKDVEERHSKRKKILLEVKNYPICYRISKGFWKGRASTNCAAQIKGKAEKILYIHKEGKNHLHSDTFDLSGIWDEGATPHIHQLLKKDNSGTLGLKMYSVPNKVLASILAKTSITPGFSKKLRIGEKIEGREYFYLISEHGYTRLQERKFRESERSGENLPDRPEPIAEIGQHENDEVNSKYGRRKILDKKMELEVKIVDGAGHLKEAKLEINNKSKKISDFSADIKK